MNYTDNKNKSYNIFIYIFALLTILQCGSIYSSNLFGEVLINGLWQILLAILCYNSLSRIPHIYIHKLIMFIGAYSIIVALLLIWEYLYSPFTFFYFFLLLIDPIMLLLYFASTLRYKHFDRSLFIKIENIVLILAVISLFFWMLNVIGVSPNMNTTIKWGGVRSIPGYDYLQFLPQEPPRSFLGISNFIRNTGMFVEVPIYAYILCIALIIELFFKEHTSKFYVLLLFITIISTTSTTGLIVAILSISYYIFISSDSIYKYLFLLLIPVVFVIVRIIFLSKVNATGSSYGVRYGGFVGDIVAWKHHLFIGNGLPTLGNNGVRQSFSLNIGLSSGLMASLAYGGITLGIFYILPTILSLNISGRVFGISISSFILFIFTIVMNFYVYVIILAYLWSLIILRNNLRYNNQRT